MPVTAKGGQLARNIVEGLRAEGIDTPAGLFTERDAPDLLRIGKTPEEISAIVDETKVQALEAVNLELVRRLRVELDTDPEGIGYAGMSPDDIVAELNREHAYTVSRNGRDRTLFRPAPIGHVWDGLPLAPAGATVEDVAAAQAFKGDTAEVTVVKLPPAKGGAVVDPAEIAPPAGNGI